MSNQPETWDLKPKKGINIVILARKKSPNRLVKREDEERLDDVGGVRKQMSQIRELVELPLSHLKDCSKEDGKCVRTQPIDRETGTKILNKEMRRSKKSCKVKQEKLPWSYEEEKLLLSNCKANNDVVHTASLINRSVEECIDKLDLLGWQCKEVFPISNEMLVKIGMIFPRQESSAYQIFEKTIRNLRKNRLLSISIGESSDVTDVTIQVSACEILGGSSLIQEAVAVLLPLCTETSSGVYCVKLYLKKSRDSILDEEDFKLLRLHITTTATGDFIIVISGDQEKEFNEKFWKVFAIVRRWFFKCFENKIPHKSLQRSVHRQLVPSKDSVDTTNSCQVLNMLGQPNTEASPPDGALAITLLKHQRIALSWMLDKERSGCPCYGGILADDQGLGKTISTIALIVTNRNPRRDQLDDSLQVLKKGKHAGTLVICPSSLMKQWYNELCEKVSLQLDLAVLIYHGPSRTSDPQELVKYDVIITSYGLVTDGGPLTKLEWFRVVLDEAQRIKNPKTKDAVACCGLLAKHRWCLSGTPIQNAIDDLYSYFRFTQCVPYSDHDMFLKLIKKPLVDNRVKGSNNLLAILKTFMLRRTKDTKLSGKSIVSLPAKSIELKRLDFNMEERFFYNKLVRDAEDKYKVYIKDGSVKKKYTEILSMLLRLRQACNHPRLVSSSPMTPSVEAAQKLGSTKTKAAVEILLKLKSDGLAAGGFVEKAIVFSQWTKMLDLLEESLQSTSIEYRRFDGNMSLENRQIVIEEFTTLPEVSVMIMSLQAASVGLNLVAANHVLLLDLWWNPSTEDQAIDRTHRIGQKRPVKVVRFVVNNTIEDRILILQEKKRRIVSSAFGENLSFDDLNFLMAIQEGSGARIQ